MGAKSHNQSVKRASFVSTWTCRRPTLKSASAQGWKRAHEDPLPRVRLKTAERGRLCAELGALYWRLGLSRLSLAFAGNRAIGAVNLQGRLQLPTWESLQDAIPFFTGFTCP